MTFIRKIAVKPEILAPRKQKHKIKIILQCKPVQNSIEPALNRSNRTQIEPNRPAALNRP